MGGWRWEAKAAKGGETTETLFLMYSREVIKKRDTERYPKFYYRGYSDEMFIRRTRDQRIDPKRHAHVHTCAARVVSSNLGECERTEP